MEEKVTNVISEKPSNKKYIIMIIVLSLFVLTSCGYIAYDEFFDNNKETKENKTENDVAREEEKEEEKTEDATTLSLSNPGVKKIYEMISEIGTCDSPMIWNFTNSSTIDVDSITTTEMYTLMLRKIELDGYLNYYSPKNHPEFTVANFNSSYKNFIGKDADSSYVNSLLEEASNSNINYDGFEYKYDKNTQKIIGIASPTGCEGPGLFVDFLYKAEKNEENFEIYVKVAKDAVDERGYYYTDLKDNFICLSTDIESCWNKMTTYKYTFTPMYVNNYAAAYHFVSVELEK